MSDYPRWDPAGWPDALLYGLWFAALALLVAVLIVKAAS